ncbi:MAG: hypothetical protein K2O89_04355 [Clostridia bacterium]|nr:hypothetical protein [Clostridia bacterium]
MKKIVSLLLVWLCLCIIPMFVACDKNDTPVENEDTSNSQQQETTKEIIVGLDKTNYSEYLDVEITTVSQSNTFKYNTYYVQYLGSSTPHTINSPTPPTGSNISVCLYLSSTYTVLTTLTVTTKSKSPDYIFTDVYLRWKAIPTNISGFIDFILDDKGIFTKTYNIYEDITLPYKNYTVSDFLLLVHGKVTYYETVDE